MFEQDSTRTYIEARPEEVLDIYTSINRSTVAVPEREPEKAQAYIASVYKGNVYHAYIYLYLATSNEGLLYHWSEGGVPGDQLTSVYQSALEFTESMGFMMDDMRYRDKNPDEKTHIHSEVPLFHADISFMRKHLPAEEKSEELVIEPLDDEDAEVAVVAEDAEEINLDVLGDEEEVGTVEIEEAPDSDEVTEITLGGGALDESAEAAAKPPPVDAVPEVEEVSIEEEAALDALEAEVVQPEPAAPPPAPEPPAAEEEDVEETLLDSLDISEEGAVAEEEAEEIMIGEEPSIDEETVEAPPMAEAVMEVEADDAELTPEEAEVLGETAPPEQEPEEEVTMELDIDQDVEAEPADTGPVPPPAPAPKAHAEPLDHGDLADEDYETLIRLLAMM